jgi:hypothetical protein
MHLNASDVRGKKSIIVSGNTFAHQNVIKSLGAPAKWDKAKQVWVLDISGMSNTVAGQIATKTYQLAKLGLNFEAR